MYVVERGGLRTFLKEKSSPSAFEPVALFRFVMGASLSELEEYSEPDAIAKGERRGGNGRRENRRLTTADWSDTPLTCDR